MTARLAAYRAGQPPRTARAAAIPARGSPGTTRYRAGARWPGSTRTVPGRMTSGSEPMRGRLAAYRAGQPPRTANRAAMPDRVSPSCTTYLAAGRAAVPGAAAALSVLVRVTSVLLAARVSAWAGRAGPVMTAATARISRTLQASTTHADFVHVCTVTITFLPRDQR